jgi:hypothetical protein
MVFKFEYWIEVAYDRSQSQIVAIRLWGAFRWHNNNKCFHCLNICQRLEER